MRKFIFDPIILIILAIIAYAVFQYSQNVLDIESKQNLQEAIENYKEGERSDNAVKRKDAFNRSLELFTSLESKYDPKYGNGKFYYDIGNNYFQLEEYPLAIFYYYKAAALRPRDTTIFQNLSLTQKKLGIPSSEESTAFENVFFFHNHLSIPERLNFFFLFGLGALLVASCYIWLRQRWLYLLIYIFLICCTVLLLSLAYSYYLSPIEGVMVKSSALYRDAGEQYAKVTEKPVPSGTKVKVLDGLPSGQWLKVLTHDGTLGYVPHSTIRVL